MIVVKIDRVHTEKENALMRRYGKITYSRYLPRYSNVPEIFNIVNAIDITDNNLV